MPNRIDQKFADLRAAGRKALIAYISAYIALDPGDLLITGTPSGVGVFREPPVFLEPGDMVRCEVEGIGRVENRVIDIPPTVT